jgi:hypothetical protein
LAFTSFLPKTNQLDMKKFLMLITICGLYSFSFSQEDSVWRVTKNTSLKGVSGRLMFDNPPKSTWTLYIYNMADNQYITSYANVNNKGSVIVSQGTYKVTINNVPVLNVPINKGHDTRLRCGVLNVVSQSYWDLSDAKGDTFYTSNNGPMKLPVPIGTYTFNLGGQKQVIVIEEGKTVEL